MSAMRGSRGPSNQTSSTLEYNLSISSGVRSSSAQPVIDMNELRCDVPPCIVIATCESVRISSTFPLSVEVMNVTSVPPSPVPPSPGPPLVEMPLHGLRDHHRTSPQLPCRGACHEHRRVELAEQLSHLFSGHSLI